MADLTDNSRRVIRAIEQATDEAVRMMALAGEGAVRRVFPQTNSPNVLAVQRGSRLSYTGSPPGTPPGVRDDRLRSSISTLQERPGVYVVGTNVKYGKVHEFGLAVPNRGNRPYIMIGEPGGLRFVPLKASTAARRRSQGKYVKMTKPSTTRMPKRPFMRPTLRREKANLERVFVDTFRRRITVLAGGDA